MKGALLQFVNVLSTWWCTVSNNRRAWLTIYLLHIDCKIYEIECVTDLFGYRSYSGPWDRNLYVRVFIHNMVVTLQHYYQPLMWCLLLCSTFFGSWC